MDLDAVEVRVLGCLIEKQHTTPDAYPLTLNALRAACNQATNRDPVVDYDERTIRDALQDLGRRRWTRLASGQGSRAPKYRHLLEETLRMSAPEQAVLAVLMLRGPQTPGELKQRTERLHFFRDHLALHTAIERLIEGKLVVRLGRRPGQKEERFAHGLGGGEHPGPSAGPAQATTGEPAGPEERVDRLERRVAALAEELGELKRALGRA